MAKIIKTDIESQTVSPIYSLRKMVFIGVALGVVYWIFNVVIGRFVDSVSITGDISTILVAVVGIAVMVRFSMIQPLIVALASGLTLWGLANLTNGLGWAEVIIWDMILYGFAYVLYSWLARYTRLALALVIMVVVIIITRVAVSL